MSFASEIKFEVLNKEFSIENALYFLSGLILTNSKTHDKYATIRINNPNISNAILQLVNELKIETLPSKENKNYILLKEFKPIKDIKLPSFFFAGAFVGGGSISDLDSTSYHLEIQVHSHMSASFMQTFLNKYRFNFSLIQRRLNWVLYIKKSESISDFLRAIEVVNAFFKFEDARVKRDFKNQLNRYSNFDVYNQNKLVAANEKFLLHYQYIKENNLEFLFKKMELTFFELKKSNAFSSLDELTRIINKKYNLTKTRAGLNHWLIKLRNVYEQNN